MNRSRVNDEIDAAYSVVPEAVVTSCGRRAARPHQERSARRSIELHASQAGSRRPPDERAGDVNELLEPPPCDITTSSCCHVFRASLPVSAIIFAPFSRTAAISARWSWIRLSLVMINHWRSATSGIQTRSNVAGSVIGHGGRVRRWSVAPGSPG